MTHSLTEQIIAIQQAREIIKMHTFDRAFPYNRIILDSQLNDAGSTIAALNLNPDRGWISVNEKLPPIGDEYNVVWDLRDGQPPVSTTVQWDSIRKIWFDETYPDGVPDILYWQPLPEPPKSLADIKWDAVTSGFVKPDEV